MKYTEQNLKSSYESRVDIVCSSELNMSRSFINKLIKNGNLYIDKQQIKKPSFIVTPNNNITLLIPSKEDDTILPEDLKINVIYEDENILAVNKECGMVVHPANHLKSGTLVNALLYHEQNLSSINGEERPGIVHRLDKDTSGIIIVAKNNSSHSRMARLIKEHMVKKYYIALVYGVLKDDEGKVIFPIARDKRNRKKMAVDPDGRYAETHWLKIAESKNTTLLLIRIITGRTHQIRVHMQYINHPIVGDKVYGHKKSDTRLMLHAYRMIFSHPITNKEMDLIASVPNDFVCGIIKYGYSYEDIINVLNNNKYLI